MAAWSSNNMINNYKKSNHNIPKEPFNQSVATMYITRVALVCKEMALLPADAAVASDASCFAATA